MKALLKKALRILPDKWFIQIQYFYWLRKFVNFKRPVTFNEKLQWLKLYDHNPKYIKLVDKKAVKEIVSKWIGEEYIIPTIGVWDNADEINYDKLPDRFVLKANHDSGSVTICRNKEKFDRDAAKKKLL